MEGIRDAGFTVCTPIQAQTLPIALAGRDVAGQAQTGTGKTAAFLLALYQALLTRPPAATRSKTSIRALIVAPTRELAVQIHHDAEILGRHTGLKQAVVYGGVDYEKQRRQLEEGVDVLIGTPGRLIDYFKQHVFDLRHAQVLVLDEADRMFDLGFIADIRYLMRRLPHPEKRQSMLFSATLSHRVLELAYEHMNNPELVRIEPDKMTVDRVRQMMYYPSMEEKVPLLVGLLRQAEARRTMIFVNTKRAAERLESTLKANGFHAQALSGDVPQNKRLRFLRDFHEGNLAVLIATDVASRGLHIPDVSHVFNFDLPQDAADYVHRIGRTARAGAEGDAISFACEEYAVSLPEIEDYLGHKIPASSIGPEILAKELIQGAPLERRPFRPHGGGSGGGGRRPPGGGGGGRPGPGGRRSGGGGGGGGRPRKGSHG
jgi:ATP-dependent RNA helicase RhlB